MNIAVLGTGFGAYHVVLCASNQSCAGMLNNEGTFLSGYKRSNSNFESIAVDE